MKKIMFIVLILFIPTILWGQSTIIPKSGTGDVSLADSLIVFETPTGAQAKVNAQAIDVSGTVTNQLIYQSAAGTFAAAPYMHKSTINWTLDSTALATYSTRFNRQWFRTGQDSIVVDSVGGIVSGAAGDSATLRVLWGQDRTVATDSCADIKIVSFTTGTIAVGTKTIPPERFVWLKVITKAGAPISIAIWLDTRRKWY
jgi:hypothetical protein